MPEGKDFVDELVVMSVVDAVADVEESSECLPALLRPHRKKRDIVLNAAYAGHALRDGDYLDAHVKMAFAPDGRLKRLLDKAKSRTLQPYVVSCKPVPRYHTI